MEELKKLDRELDWEDIIEKESSGFILLPEGDYEFEVIGFDRARHTGSEKIPPCNKAILKLKIKTPENDAVVILHNLFLHSVVENFLSSFFASIGQKKKGEPLKMNWSTVVGSKGRAHIYIDNYKSQKDGSEHKSNKVKKFYPIEEAEKPAFNYTEGKF